MAFGRNAPALRPAGNQQFVRQVRPKAVEQVGKYELT